MTDPRRVAIVVLGDLGRSPRMQFHALALADDGVEVDLVGYAGKPASDLVTDHPRIRVHLLAPPWRQRAPKALFVPAALGGLAGQTLALGRLLATGLPRPDTILVQNPPAFPTLAVAPLVASLRRARLIVDWHNFGADLLALRLGAGNPLVRVARAAERRLGQAADAHLCVSAAMRDTLAARWGVTDARVLYDRPARLAGPTPLAERRRLFDGLQLGVDPSSPTRPGIVITSSSWTLDEDFGPLLEAMERYDAAARARPTLPDLLVLMTGDGPRRRHWEERIAALGLARVRTRTLWVLARDYPLLLGAADVGLSLHRSASGVDLPMKIVDMFGAGLPVCALAYGPVLAEQVRAGENGLLFTTGAELGRQLEELFDGFPGATARLDDLRRGVARRATESWSDGWRREARDLFGGAVASSRSSGARRRRARDAGARS